MQLIFLNFLFSLFYLHIITSTGQKCVYVHIQLFYFFKVRYRVDPHSPNTLYVLLPGKYCRRKKTFLSSMLEKEMELGRWSVCATEMLPLFRALVTCKWLSNCYTSNTIGLGFVCQFLREKK